MNSPIIKRILVPLAAQRPPLGLLENAADLAARLQSELCGLFIEDSDLLNFAQLPIGREFSFSTGRIEPSSMASMERSLRQSASRSQQELTRLASHYKIQSQFVTRRGYTQQTVQMEVQPGDLLILSAQGQQANRLLVKQADEFLKGGHHYLAWLPPNSLPVSEITVIQDSSHAAKESLELAEMLSKGNGTQVTRLQSDNLDALIKKRKATKTGLWIVPYHPEWDITQLEQLLTAGPCPILIVNG